MSQEFNAQEIVYIGLSYGSDSKIQTFEYSNFIYDVYTTLDNQVQFIKGQSSVQLTSEGQVPTQEELDLHDEREEIYNGNHVPIQNWINTL